ncbi:MAG: gliding motility protein GldL [Bacteroidaceae bacterium]|nr:gliding motility protein GldL [Bacteroidaceae bacterium]
MSNKSKSTGIQGWMDSKAGQMFLNYAYSWGAAIVILGALFKLTHIHGADLMLFIGMGTEVIVFFLSGFERPWTDDGKPEVDSEEVDIEAKEVRIVTENTYTQKVDDEPNDAPVVEANVAAVPQVQVPQIHGMTPEMAEATQGYVEQLNQLTETLKQVSEQSARLTRDSEEMETMNRTLTGINRFYEMQLRSVGQQSTTIDDVNAQTKKLAEQLEELNAVYARMVEALKMNMKGE